MNAAVRSVGLVLVLALVALVSRSEAAFAAVRADYRFAGNYESSEGGPAPATAGCRAARLA